MSARIERFVTPGLAQVAYIVADPNHHTAAVIDPRRDVDDYLTWARGNGYQIVAILETHVHADFASGARELGAATSAPVYAGQRGETEFPHRPLDDGEIVPVGNLALQAMWTPGHTPEHIAYLLRDPSQGEDPIALFSGDVLFAGEIGRPDLLGPDQTSGLIQQLYDTVHTRLASLSDDVVVYPGHGAGSPCGKNISDAARTTIGQEKRFNYAFQAASPEAFVTTVMEGMPPPPAYYPVMKRLNTRGPALLKDLPPGAPLAAHQVAAHRDAGALLIDARSPHEFAAGHIPGSVNVGLVGNFTLWAGALAPYDRDVVLILPADDRYDAARTDLRRIGIDRVAGYLAGGIDAWTAGKLPAATLAEMTVAELASAVGPARNGLMILDVRDKTEWERGHIPGARNVPAGDIARGVVPDLDGAAPVVVVCGSGYRASVAASLLHRAGVPHVVTTPGGMDAWNAAGFPTEQRAAERRPD
jgi:hydroxyacylglutathione hydrolase